MVLNSISNLHEAFSRSANNSKAENCDQSLRRAIDAKKAACGLEAIFVHQLLKEMSKTTLGKGIFTKGFADKIYEDMLFEKISNHVAKKGEFGIARLVYNEILEENCLRKHPFDDENLRWEAVI